MNVPWVAADAIGFLGWEALTSGDLPGAEAWCEEAFQLADRTNPDLLSVARYVMTKAALARGDYALARAQLVLFLRDNYYNFPPVPLGLRLAGTLALRQAVGDLAQLRCAARLFGAQDALSPCLENVIPQIEREAYQASLEALRAALSQQELESAWAEGLAMTTSQAIEAVMSATGL